MTQKRLAKSIRSIIVFAPTDDGSLERTVLYKAREKKKRKRSTLLAPIEAAARRLMSANRTAAEAYLERHDVSARKRRDGWLVDLPNNVLRAGRKGMKKIIPGV